MQKTLQFKHGQVLCESSLIIEKTSRHHNSSTKVPGNAWYMPRVRYRMKEYEEHPSQKPEALLERIIKVSSNPGDRILDPFCGTFTTCAVAQRLNRHSIDIELQDDYVKIGLRRLNIATHFNGESIEFLEKNYIRKHNRKEQERIVTEYQGRSFDVNV